MGTLLIVLEQFIVQSESMIVRRYGKKYGDGGMFFNAFICLFASVFFLLTDKGGLYFPKELWLYGIISCILFATGFYTMYVALATGSYVGAKMFSGFSGIIPITYGILFLKESASATTYIATALIFLSVFLRAYQKPGSNKNESTPLKWYIYLLLSAISNGFISVISRMQQIRFDHAYDNEFMIISFLGSFAFLFTMGLIKERGKLFHVAKYGILYGAGAGLFNGANNLVNLMIFLYLPISLSTPLRQGFGILVGFVIAKFLYKETYTKRELLSIIIGGIAVILFKV